MLDMPKGRTLSQRAQHRGSARLIEVDLLKCKDVQEQVIDQARGVVGKSLPAVRTLRRPPLSYVPRAYPHHPGQGRHGRLRIA
jgi:hypothetical protein